MIGKCRLVVVVTALVLAAFLAGCGNPLEGGSEPSGSVLFIEDFSHDISQDISFCEGEGVEYAQASFTVRNESRPNFEDSPTTADGTNSRVTLYRYRVDYTVLNFTGTVPSLDGAGIGGTIEPGGTAEIDGLLLISESQLDYIRGNYPAIGNGQSMNLRADVTIWGKDEFQVDVTVPFAATLVVDDFNPCSADILPSDEASN